MKLTPTQKRTLLKELIELYIFNGYDITNLVGRSLQYFDYEKVAKNIEEQKKEKLTIEDN